MNPNDDLALEEEATLTRRSFLGAAAATAGLLALLPRGLKGADTPKVDPFAWDSKHLSATGFETLHLTWAADPRSTMRIQWLQAETTAGEAPEPVRLFFRVSGGGDFTSVPSKAHRFGAPQTRIWVQRVDLSGLAADTLHEFRVGDSKEILRFRTAPGKIGDGVTFAEGGDIGITKPDVVEKLHRLACSWDPLFAHVGGDLSYSNGVTLDIELQFLAHWRKWMVAEGNRIVPIVPGIGNHEVQGGMGKTPAEAPYFYALFEGLFTSGGAFGVLDFGDWMRLVMLDTDHTARVEAQNDFLARSLKEGDRFPHLLVSYHVGAYPSVRDDKGKTPTLIRKHWLPILEDSKVRIVFEHHDHAFKKTLPLRKGVEAADGILYLGDGDWGRETRKVKTKEERPYLDKVSSDFNLWKVTLRAKKQEFSAWNEKLEQLDAFEKTL